MFAYVGYNLFHFILLPMIETIFLLLESQGMWLRVRALCRLISSASWFVSATHSGAFWRVRPNCGYWLLSVFATFLGGAESSFMDKNGFSSAPSSPANLFWATQDGKCWPGDLVRSLGLRSLLVDFFSSIFFVFVNFSLSLVIGLYFHGKCNIISVLTI